MSDFKQKPKLASGSAQAELDKAEKQFEAFDENVKAMTMDRMNEAPKADKDEPHISQREIANSKDVYLKPHKSIGAPQKFNEKFRDAYNHDKEYVHFIAVNNEIIGETIDIWTRPYGGMPAEEWLVPCNKPVWGPRYLAEQIKRRIYHRLVMQENKMVSSDHNAQYFGQMAADTTIQRMDAMPVSSRKSIFTGSKSF